MALVHNCLSDTILFPRESSYFEMSDSRQMGGFDGYEYDMNTAMPHDFPDLIHSTYDSYTAHPGYGSIEQNYYNLTPQFVVNGPKDNTIQSSHRFEHSESPSTSMSQALDHVPSNLSHTSGASGQSSASSVVGSPYSQATHSLSGQEFWVHHSGLGIGPSIVNEPSIDPFSLSGAESEPLLFASDKFSGNFVGESRKLSSSFISGSPVLASPISYSSHTSGSLASCFSSPALALDTSLASRQMTIDTILEEVNAMGIAMHAVSPISTKSPSTASPTTIHQAHVQKPPQPKNTTFKSPTTPASATASFASSLSRKSGSRKRSLPISNPRDACTDQTPPKRATPPPASPSHIYGNPFQTPFFGQSSGRFVAPLQSTCWFSLRYILLSFRVIQFGYFSFRVPSLFQGEIGKIC